MDKDNNQQAESTVPAPSAYMDIQKKNAFDSKPTVPTTTAAKPVQSTSAAKTTATTATAADATAQTSPQGHELTLAPGNRHENVDAQEVAYRKIMEANMPESDADKAKREKRERAKKIIAAVGDGLSSIANIYFATKGAPSMYNPDNGMSARLRERLDKDAADREAKRAKFLEASLGYGKRREEIANAARAADALRSQNQMAAQAHGMQIGVMQSEINKNNAQARSYDRQHLPMTDEEVDNLNSKTNLNNANANKANKYVPGGSRGGKGNNGGNGGNNGQTAPSGNNPPKKSGNNPPKKSGNNPPKKSGNNPPKKKGNNNQRKTIPGMPWK